MNFTQNEKMNQVTADTLIVGVNIGSQHFARAFDWKGAELVRWMDEMQQRTGMKKIRGYQKRIASPQGNLV